MPGTVNQRASPRYLPKTNVGFVREQSLLFLILPLDKSHFITEDSKMNVTSSGIINGVIQPQYGGHGARFNEAA